MTTLQNTQPQAPAKRWHWLLAGAVAYLALLALHLPIKPYSDDLFYMDGMRQSNVFALVGDYYLHWSGRVTSNFLAYGLVGSGAFWLWKLLNPMMVLLLCWGMVRLVQPKPRLQSCVVALLLLFVLGPGVLDYAVFWATGSVYYLWPLAGAVLLMHPFLDLALRRQTAIKWYPLRVVLAALCCMCNEQISACVVAFMAVILLRHFVAARKLPARHLVLLALCVAGALVLFLAPGGSERMAVESARYGDKYGVDFGLLPLGQKLQNGLAWMFGMLFANDYLVLVLLFFAFWAAGRQSQKPAWGMALFGLGALAVAFSFPRPVQPVFSFLPLGQVFSGGLAGLATGLAPYLFWLVFFAALVVMAGRQGFYNALALLAAVCTLVVLFFSPTLFDSGERTMMVAGVLFITLLLGRMKAKLPAPALVTLACLVAVNLYRLVGRLAVFWA